MKLPLLLGLILLAPAAAASGSVEQAVAFLDWANFLIAILCIFFALAIVNNTGAVLGRAFVFITMSIIFFASIRLFLHLAGMLSETTTLLGWHFLFYIAAALLIAALQSLKSFGSGYTQEKLISPMMALLFVLLVLLGVSIFISASPLNAQITHAYHDTPMHRFGAEHFIAFAMMAYATYLLISVKHLFGKTIINAVAPMFVSTVSFTLLHLWELLTENWHVLNVPHNIIEPVEGVLFLIAMAGILIAIAQIKKAL